MEYKDIALRVPEILLPRKGIDFSKWAVVACDQFTSQPEYWEEVKRKVGSAPSTLNLFLPEVYLGHPDKEEIIRNIKHTMIRYIKEGILQPLKPGFVLVDRSTPYTQSRKGLVVTLDLEEYDYRKGSISLIRATEGTIVERLPPKIIIREGSTIESQHIMVLIDDPEKTVIEPLFNAPRKKIYDFDLMMEGGHITGYHISEKEVIESIAQNLRKLADPNVFGKKYNVSGQHPLLYAIGDGNHSLATAKEIWNKIKESSPDKNSIMGHPARYALVELVNVHDVGLKFEPIHRILFNVEPSNLLESMQKFFEKAGSKMSLVAENSKTTKTKPSRAQAKESSQANAPSHEIHYIHSKGKGIIRIENPKSTLAVGTLQSFLDSYMKENSNVKIDYVHGDEIVEKLSQENGNIGFLLPALSKHDLFKTVILEGALSRKTFSMGEAPEKRYYLECRKIIENQ